MGGKEDQRCPKPSFIPGLRTEPQHHPPPQGAPSKERLNWVNWDTLSPLSQGFGTRWNNNKIHSQMLTLPTPSPANLLGKTKGKGGIRLSFPWSWGWRRRTEAGSYCSSCT